LLLSRLTLTLLFGACCLVQSATPAAAQTANGSAPTERLTVLPDAAFEALFRKFASPSTDFSRLYSWDAQMALDAAVLRKGRDTLTFRSTFQSVGTENVGSQVSVGGTGYILSLGYQHAHSPEVMLSAGLTHLSSHLTRDLDEKLDEIRREGGIIPDVVDPSEYNVFFFSARRTLPTWWLTPEVEISIQPVNFRFNGRPAGRVRPIYLGTRLTPWRGGGTSIVVTTQHEIGPNGFNYFAVAFQLDGRSRPEGRLQLFVGGSPGGGLHVSPNVGALRDGFALGVRMAFGA